MAPRVRIFVDLGSAGSRLHTLSESQLIVPLDKKNQHHLKNVLRLALGDLIEVVCRSSGKVYSAAIVIKDSEYNIELLEELQQATKRGVVATLIFALAKGDKNDFIAEKATELGVDQIVFWAAERSIVKIKTDQDLIKKLSRWRSIAEGAAKQSKRNGVPSIHFIKENDELLKLISDLSQPGDLHLLCSLSVGAASLRSVSKPTGRAHLLVGPEGDLAGAEEEFLCKHGFVPISLGSNILRCETAAVAGIAMLRGLWE